MNVQNKFLLEGLRSAQARSVEQKQLRKTEAGEFDRILQDQLTAGKTQQSPLQARNGIAGPGADTTGIFPSGAHTPSGVHTEEISLVTGGVESVRYSKHAIERLEARNITLTPAQKEGMARALDKAESKGLRDSLILLDNLAFVVNVKNRTVVTAAHTDELRENVFTNIDGAVIMSSRSISAGPFREAARF